MKDFKIKFKNGRKELELEAGSIETPDEWHFIKHILSSFDIHTGDLEIDTLHEVKKEEKLETLKEGYNTLNTGVQGLHRPVSEFENSSMIHAFQKAREKSGAQILLNEPPTFKNSSASIRTYGGVSHYQCYYICPKCLDKNKRYILPDTKTIVCKTFTCGEVMDVRDATNKGFPYEDVYHNVFIAGTFVRVGDSPKTTESPAM
ncbi:hypothetical protein [Bacillus cereus]